MRKKLVLMIMFVVLGICIGACGNGTDDTAGNDGENSGEASDISIASAGAAGTFYVMAAGFSDLLNNEHDHLNTVAEITGGSVENAKLINDHNVELAVMQMDVALNAFNGTDQFEEPIDMVALLPMYPNLVQIVTLADSDIDTFSDLKGKTVSVGEPGSGVLATNEMLFKQMGMSLDEDIKPEYLSFSETTNAFRNGDIDAAIVNTAAPAPFITDLETTHDVKFVSFSDDEIEKFTTDYEYFVKDVIPTDAYNSLEEDVQTFAVWIALTTNSDLPEDTAYDIVQSILENNEFLQDVHVVSEYVKLDNVENIKGIPFHSGAAKYYDEQEISYDESVE